MNYSCDPYQSKWNQVFRWQKCFIILPKFCHMLKISQPIITLMSPYLHNIITWLEMCACCRQILREAAQNSMLSTHYTVCGIKYSFCVWQTVGAGLDGSLSTSIHLITGWLNTGSKQTEKVFAHVCVCKNTITNSTYFSSIFFLLEGEKDSNWRQGWLINITER